MKKNDIITLVITAIANNGQGLGRHEGAVVFVPFSAVGDTLAVRILKVAKSYAYGKIEEILSPSASRIDPECPVYGKCGGCDFRHMDYQSELAAKEEFIRDAFTRIGGVTPVFLPIIPNESIKEYRNKAQYPIGKNKDKKPIYGFYRRNSHDIIEVGYCAIQPKIFGRIADFVMKLVEKYKISVYNEAEHTGVLRHVLLRKGHYSGEVCLTFVARRHVPEFGALAKEVKNTFPDIKSVVININKDRTNVVLGDCERIYGEKTITDKMCGLDIEISPKSFYQVNTPAAERIYGIARNFAEPEGKTIVDLYCGTGTIGLSMTGAEKIIGIEISESAVRDAVSNAERNKIENACFICADAGQGAESLKNEGTTADVVILDPARKGCSDDTIKYAAQLGAERIVMISCNPVTAAADCAQFAKLGYRTVKVCGVDLFSRTKHVETVILMSRDEIVDCNEPLLYSPL